jgi:hypothetical protein
MKRNSVSQIQPRFYDGQRVDQQDMTVEQDRNLAIDASIINNHFGSGVLPLAITQKILFDTDNMAPDQIALLASNDFDGTGITPTLQPTDSTLGNIVEIEYSDSTGSNGVASAFGRRTVKVYLIGVDFQGQIQREYFSFARKEKQVSRKHYARVLSVLFNDFLGNNNCSRRLGGRIVIKEATSLQISRDTIMISQDESPLIPYRDFKISTFSSGLNPTVTLQQTLQDAIGSEFTVDALNINTSAKRNFEFPTNDVTLKAGQKFLAYTNNIQKISVLLGVNKDSTKTTDKWYDWSGELVVSVYELQSSVNSPSDLVPGLAIEFEPSAIPITQTTFSITDLYDLGYVLNDVLQPIDLVFNNSILGLSNGSSVLVPGKYYMVTIGRAGDASVGTLFTGIGAATTTEARLSIFAGSVWTDVSEESLWYQVWTDAAKIADGQAYDNGNGVQIEKTTINSIGATVDNCFGLNVFSDNGQGTLNTAIMEAVLTPSAIEQDERTGSPVYSRQKFDPSFSFVLNSALTDLKTNSDPLVIGVARDINPKSNAVITGSQIYPGLVKGDTYIIVNPDANLLSQQLIGSKLIPNDDCQGFGYRIFDVLLCTDGYGDVNGDGVIDIYDSVRATQLIGESISSATTQQKIKDGYIDTLELLRADVNGDGYIDIADVTAISNYINKSISTFSVGSSFQHLEIRVQQSIGRDDGYFDCSDGYVRLDGYSSQNKVPVSSLSFYEMMYDGYLAPVYMEVTDPIFTTIPFAPVSFRIKPQLFWRDWLVQFNSDARLVPAAFTNFDSLSIHRNLDGSCNEEVNALCVDPYKLSSSLLNTGKNDLFVPNDLYVRGQILNVDGTHFKQDLEISTVILELPDSTSFTNAVMNIFQNFVYNYSNTGYTRASYPAMKFSDCTYVESDALVKNQVRFAVAIQSIDTDVSNAKMQLCVMMDQSTGILTLTAYNELNEFAEVSACRIEITVYLKKAGWNNNTLKIDATQTLSLFS